MEKQIIWLNIPLSILGYYFGFNGLNEAVERQYNGGNAGAGLVIFGLMVFVALFHVLFQAICVCLYPKVKLENISIKNLVYKKAEKGNVIKILAYLISMALFYLIVSGIYYRSLTFVLSIVIAMLVVYIYTIWIVAFLLSR